MKINNFSSVTLLLTVSLALPCAVQAAIKTKINPKDGAQMVYVPAGAFTMGSDRADQDAGANEKPAHSVTLSDYWIYKNDVTVAQYKRFCAATKHKMPKAPWWGWIDTHPMVNVNWYAAQAYCAWAVVKLPTEAQWEKAARGTDGREYPWGNVWEVGRANADSRKFRPFAMDWQFAAASKPKEYYGQTTPVGSFPNGASPYGVLDMAGNVWNWCSDWYGANYYQHSPHANPQGPAKDANGWKVLRGGAWFLHSNACRSAGRDSLKPYYTYNEIGFRCVLIH